MLHFQENGSTMPTAGTAPERPVHSFRRSVMLHLSRLVYNEIQKVTVKGRLTRHFPDGNPEQDPLEGRKGLNGRKMPLQTLWRTSPDDSPSEGETISRGNCTPSEGGNGLNGRKTPLQTLWRTWPRNSPSEGGTSGHGLGTHLPKVGRFRGETAHLPKVGRSGEGGRLLDG